MLGEFWVALPHSPPPKQLKNHSVQYPYPFKDEVIEVIE